MAIARLLREWGQILLYTADTKMNGWSVLHHAVQRGHIAVIQLLLDAGADVNAKDRVWYFLSSSV